MDRLRRTRAPARPIAGAWPSQVPTVAWKARPTCPTLAAGYYENTKAAVPSKEPRETPCDGAGPVMKWRRNTQSCRSARQMLRSATLER